MEYTSINGTTASDWITTTYNPTPTTTTASGGTITITPDTLVTSPSYTYASPASISLSMLGEKEVEEKIKKARDDVDKHVDELEQDLEYLNEQRQALEQTVLDMGDRIAAQDDLIDELQMKLERAMNQIEVLQERAQEYINNNILGRIYSLEDRLYEMDKRTGRKLLWAQDCDTAVKYDEEDYSLLLKLMGRTEQEAADPQKISTDKGATK